MTIALTSALLDVLEADAELAGLLGATPLDRRVVDAWPDGASPLDVSRPALLIVAEGEEQEIASDGQTLTVTLGDQVYDLTVMGITQRVCRQVRDRVRVLLSGRALEAGGYRAGFLRYAGSWPLAPGLSQSPRLGMRIVMADRERIAPVA